MANESSDISATKSDKISQGGQTEEPDDDKTKASKKWIWLDDCLGGKKLVVYKTFYFFFYGAFGIIIAYLPLYFKQLGLLASHVGLLTGARPLLQSVGAPFWGMLADKLRIRKTILLAGLIAFTFKTVLFMGFRPSHQTCEINYINKTHNIKTVTAISHNADKFKRGFHLFPMTAQGTQSDICENAAFVTKRTLNNEMCFISNTPNARATTRNKRETKRTPRDVVFSKVTRRHDRKHSEKRADILKRKKSRDLNGKTIVEVHKNFTIIYTRHNDKTEMQHLFIIFLLMILIGEFLESPTMTLTDASCLSVLKEKKHYYGRVRMWGSVGHGFSVPIVGFFIHGFRQIVCGDTHGDYFILFIFFAGFAIFAFLTATKFRFSYEDEQPTWRSAMFLMRFRYAVFLLVAFYLGCCHGFLLNFINWYIDDLGATTLIMGIAGGLKSLTDVLVFSLAGYVITTIGYANVLNCTLFSYALCFLGYSYMQNPWFALPVEILQAGSYAATWSACVSFIANATPMQSPATIQGTRFIIFTYFIFRNFDKRSCRKRKTA